MSTTGEDQKTTEKSGGRRRVGKVLLILCAVLIISAAAMVALFSYRASLCTLIFPHTLVDGIDVGGLSSAQAELLLAKKLQQDYSGKELPLILPSGKTLSLSAETAGAGPDVEAAAAAAYSRGRESGVVGGGIIYLFSYIHKANLSAEYALKQPDYVRSVISEAAAQVDQNLQQTVCRVNPTELVITKGITGLTVDQDALYREVSEALFHANFAAIPISPAVHPFAESKLPYIWLNIYIGPKNAYYDKEARTIQPHVTGVSFDLTAAQTMLQQAAEGSDLTIPYVYTEPELTTVELKALLFRDVLGSCTSTIGGTDNRVSNVSLAASFVNDTILLPGEIFSYNGLVGSRTTARGFLPAPAYVGGQTVDEIGGGICQVSSTAYLAALRANLRITERHPHMYAVGYLPDGLDATVYYGSLDFCFQNDTTYPILIETTSENRRLVIKIYGTKLDGTYVKMENKQVSFTPYETIYQADETIPLGEETVDVTGYSARKVEVYRNLYRENGTLISRTLESVNNYKRRDKIVLVNPADSRLFPEAGVTNAAEYTPEPSAIPLD